MLDKKIISIFQQKLQEKVVNITDCSKGIEQIVKIVTTEKNKYIIKFPHPGSEAMIFREYFACTRIKGVPLPKIICYSKKYIIESFVYGQSLNEVKINKIESKKIYTDLGRLIKKIHQVKMKGIGSLQTNSRAKHTTPASYLAPLFRQHEPELLKTSLVNKKLMQQIRSFIYDNLDPFDAKQSVLLHFDLIDDNILVEKHKISGIIDFGDASCGPREYDLAKAYIEKGDKIFSYILAGYGKKSTDIKKVKYFAVLHLLYIIPYFYSTNKTRYIKYVRLLKKLINNQ